MRKVCFIKKKERTKKKTIVAQPPTILYKPATLSLTKRDTKQITQNNSNN